MGNPSWKRLLIPAVPRGFLDALSTLGHASTTILPFSLSPLALFCSHLPLCGCGLIFRSFSALQVQLGVLDLEARQCILAENVYGAVVCPAGFFKVTEEAFDSQCMELGSECGTAVDDVSLPRSRFFPPV